MKNFVTVVLCSLFYLSCTDSPGKVTQKKSTPITGTWQLITGTVTESGKSKVTDYTKNISFIKIINETHFSFLQHDRKKGKDPSPVFVAGGGHYSLKDSIYTEHLEYCSAREWEGNDFTFTVVIKNDTLIQRGIEKVAGTAINRLNVEKYVRLTN